MPLPATSHDSVVQARKITFGGQTRTPEGEAVTLHYGDDRHPFAVSFSVAIAVGGAVQLVVPWHSVTLIES